MIFENIENSLDFWLCVNCNFSYIECGKIWSDDTEHYWDKWETSDHNALIFYQRLDAHNRYLLFEWYTKYS